MNLLKFIENICQCIVSDNILIISDQSIVKITYVYRNVREYFIHPIIHISASISTGSSKRILPILLNPSKHVILLDSIPSLPKTIRILLRVYMTPLAYFYFSLIPLYSHQMIDHMNTTFIPLIEHLPIFGIWFPWSFRYLRGLQSLLAF